MNIFKNKDVDVYTYLFNTDNEFETKDTLYTEIRQSYKLIYDTKIENNDKTSCVGIWEAVAVFNRTEYAAPSYKKDKTIKSKIVDASDQTIEVIIYDHCMFQLFNDMLSSKIEYKPFNDDIIDILVGVFEPAKMVGYIDYAKTIDYAIDYDKTIERVSLKDCDDENCTTEDDDDVELCFLYDGSSPRDKFFKLVGGEDLFVIFNLNKTGFLEE